MIPYSLHRLFQTLSHFVASLPFVTIGWMLHETWHVQSVIGNWKKRQNNTCCFFGYVKLVVLEVVGVIVFAIDYSYSYFVDTAVVVVSVQIHVAADVVAIDHDNCVEIMFAHCPIRGSTAAAAVAAADSYCHCHCHHPK